MTRTMIGVIAASALALALLAGVLIPTAFPPAYDSMLAHANGMGGMPMMGSGSMPMMGSGSMPGHGMPWHQHAGYHHPWQDGTR